MANVIAKASSAWMTNSTWCQPEAGVNAIQLTYSSTTNTTTAYVNSTAITATNADVLTGIMMMCKQTTITGTVTIGLDTPTQAAYAIADEKQPAGGLNKNWYGLGIDVDGTNLIAGDYGGRLWTSANSGVAWTERQPAGAADKNWRAIASDNDGSLLIAGDYGGRLWTSANSGVAWTERQPAGAADKNWRTAALDDDGSNIIVGDYGGRLWTSANSGVAWTERQPAGVANKNWVAVASDSDGSALIAADYGGRLWTSANSGAAWTERKPDTIDANNNWIAVASDTDGSFLIAAIENGRVWVSSDSGVNWVEKRPTGVNESKNWVAVASDSTGTRLLAMVNNGRIYASADSGINWLVQNIVTADDYNWKGLAVSNAAVGLTAGYTFVGVDAGRLYTTIATYTREVVVNASDLPVTASYLRFMFAIALTADGGVAYKVGVKSSSAGNATFNRDATAGNWTRLILLNADYGPPQAADVIYITGQAASAITVTMDNTAATDHGPIDIGHNGELTFGTTGGIAYYLKLSGDLTLWPGSTLSLGTSGTRIPVNSTAVIEFDCASACQYGLIMYGGTFNAYGITRTYVSAKLAANVLVNGTSLTTDVSTGWKSGDEIFLPSTTTTYSQHEKGDLDGDAAGTTLTVHGFAGAGGGVANAHSGTAPYVGEVALLSRNVKLHGASSTNTFYMRATAGTLNWSYAEFYWIGMSDDNKRGVKLSVTAADIQYCAIHTFAPGSPVYGSFYLLASSTLTFSYNTIYTVSASNTAVKITTIPAAGVVTYNIFAGMYQLYITACLGNCSYNTFTSMRYPNFDGAWAATAVCSYNVLHSNEAHLAVTATSFEGVTIESFTSWRSSNGISIGVSGTYKRVLFLNCALSGRFDADGDYLYGITFRGCAWEGDATYPVNYGFYLNNACYIYNMRFENCTFGLVTAHASYDMAIYCASVLFNTVFDNCKLNSGTPVQTGTGDGISGNDFWYPDLDRYSEIHFAKWAQTAGSHRTYRRNGLIQTDAVVYDGSGVSERVTPKCQRAPTFKLTSSLMRKKVANGNTATFTVRVRKSAVGDAGGVNYVGSEPRLMLRVNNAAGITQAIADVALDTMTAAVGNWETLTGTTNAVTDDAVLEAYVDCDGSVGWINVQNWS
jgi:hypothetical protein